MKPNHTLMLSLLLALPVAFSACAAIQPAPVTPVETGPNLPPPRLLVETEIPTPQPQQIPKETAGILPVEGSPREDTQGNIIVVVTPIVSVLPGETLDFEVSMDTHSVDLSMDLADLATLRTDNGLDLQPIEWDAPRGGHHVSGRLSFRFDDSNEPLLRSATRLTLTLWDVDAPTRIFAWNLPGG